MTVPLPLEVVQNDVAVNFTRLFAALRASIVQQLFVIWFSMDSYRGSDLDGWLENALPLIQAGQETSASATAAYLDTQLNLLGVDGDVSFDPALVTGPAIRGGIPPEEVYARPLKEVWDALSRGVPFDEAIANGANRLRQLVETDIQLVHTNTARNIISRESRLQGFRRVPTGSFTCALCLVASTQRYRSFDLMPIHPGCDCRVAPVTDINTVSQVIDGELLEDVHRAIEKQFGVSARDAREIDYRKILLVREHGEYGPTLTVSEHRFTGPSRIAPAEPIQIA